ncbi:predicted protein [Histoplasma capsulatum var. duboisii H88]|uniref:Predicted protein n=1 Tax=Ajellomyces capsulatus (strain H88) TaxID=544711 RepID=F0ULZ7_AJEC8|nr:predicted protein [Histoplasma capsulatum var. duboisii H88]
MVAENDTDLAPSADSWSSRGYGSSAAVKKQGPPNSVSPLAQGSGYFAFGWNGLLRGWRAAFQLQKEKKTQPERRCVQTPSSQPVVAWPNQGRTVPRLRVEESRTQKLRKK